jgi:hypothetical protein
MTMPIQSATLPGGLRTGWRSTTAPGTRCSGSSPSASRPTSFAFEASLAGAALSHA